MKGSIKELDNLEVIESKKGYHLQWYLTQEEDMGGNLGDIPEGTSREKYLSTCEWDERIAFTTAEVTATGRDSLDGFSWSSRTQAMVARKTILAGWKEYLATKKACEKVGTTKKALLGAYTVSLAKCLAAKVSPEELAQAQKEAEALVQKVSTK